MAISELNLLVRRCLHRRLAAEEFSKVLSQYQLQEPFSGRDIVAALLNASLNFCVEDDPILPQYQQILLLNHFIDLVDLLVGYIQLWKGVIKLRSDAIPKLIPVESSLISRLGFPNGINTNKARKCVSLASRWLQALVLWSTEKSVKGSSSLVEAVALFLASLLDHPTALASKQVYELVQAAIDSCMTSFPNISMQFMNKLSSIPKPSSGGEGEAASPNTLNIAAFQYEANIHETQIIPIRSSNTSYLNWLLRYGMTIDDASIFSFINARYQSNHSIIFNEILLSTIDACLKSPDSTSEMYQAQCQMFVLDKLPSILSFTVTSAFETFSSEEILVAAWDYLKDTSLESIQLWKKFLQICSLYHLISIESVTTLTGEDSGGLKGLYAKEDLVNQVAANHSRGARLVEELLKHEGSGGSFAQAIAEIMHNYCITRDTQHLKDMANAIVRKPAAMNAISLHIKPSMFLNPFCTLLDEWKWDEIHGESQPVYDEFGSVLLLIFAFKQRLNLKDSEIGIQRSDGFVAKFMAAGYAEQELSKLSDAEIKYLGDWIQSLYIDEGISDELTTNCSAHDFYLLIPTLVRQSVLAKAKGRLSADTLKTGLEYLLEPFLLPSLLSVFGWVERIAEKDPTTAAQIIQIFNKQTGSPESREIKATILDMSADRMEFIGLDKNRTLSPLIKSLKHVDFSLAVALRRLHPKSSHRLNDLTQNLVEAGARGEPFSSSILSDSISSHGPAEVIRTMIRLLIQYSSNPEFHTLLDFQATIVSSSSDLRNAIQILHARLATYLSKGDTVTAEAIVHLHRRISLYYTAFTAQDLGMDHSFVPLAGMNIANLNLDAVPPANFDQPDQTTTEDIDQILNDSVAMGGLDQGNNSAFDDIYGFQGDLGLENLDDIDLDMF